MTRRALLLFLVGVGFVLGSCQEYVFEPVVSTVFAVSNEEYFLPDTSKADILFVIDDSGSMAGEQANLAANFEAFINALEDSNADRVDRGKTPVDYRLAVTSTSVSLRYDRTTDPVVTSYHQIDHPTYYPNGCQSAYTLENGMPYPDGRLMAAPDSQAILTRQDFVDNRAAAVEMFRKNVRLGVCGSGQEQGLLAAKRALERAPDFLRPNSRLVLAFLSDEEDCSDPGQTVALTNGADRCVEEAAKPDDGRLGPVQDYVDWFNAFAADPSRGGDVVAGVITSARREGDEVVADLCSDPACEADCVDDCVAGCPAKCAARCLEDDDPPACEADCQATCPPACRAPGYARGLPCYCGAQSPGGRYIDFANAIDGSLKDSICQADFSATLEALADTIVPVDCIDLSDRPHDDDPSFILLRIQHQNGETVICEAPAKGEGCESGADWSYDPNGPRICFCEQEGSACAIEGGDHYLVSFVEEACSELHPCSE